MGGKLGQTGSNATVAYRPFTALTYYILWLSSALSTKCAVLIHYATVVLRASGILRGNPRAMFQEAVDSVKSRGASVSPIDMKGSPDGAVLLSATAVGGGGLSRSDLY